MRPIRSILFRVRRSLGFQQSGRTDARPRAELRAFRRRHPRCLIEADLEIRGPRNACDAIELGQGAAIDRGCILWISDESAAAPRIHLSARTYVGPYSYLGSHQPLSILDDTIIGGFSYIITANHRFTSKVIPIRDQGYVGAPVTIGRGVWLGCHVVVLPGVAIGDGAIVGAGSVVTKNVPSGEIWAGAPARFIKHR